MTTPSRQDVRRQRRQQIEERSDRERRGARRRVLMRRVRIGGVVGLLVLAVAGGLFWAVQEATAPAPGEFLPSEGQSHVEVGTALQYRATPPASGPHFGATARYEFSDSPVSPGFWVHNLEHGGVVFLYKCPENCAELKSQMRALYNKFPKTRSGRVKLVIAPDDSIQGRVVALAWTYRFTLDSYDEDKLRRFYDGRVDKGPECQPLCPD